MHTTPTRHTKAQTNNNTPPLSSSINQLSSLTVSVSQNESPINSKSALNAKQAQRYGQEGKANIYKKNIQNNILDIEQDESNLLNSTLRIQTQTHIFNNVDGTNKHLSNVEIQPLTMEDITLNQINTGENKGSTKDGKKLATEISHSSREILLQAEIIELQMKCSVLMGIIHKNNYKNQQNGFKVQLDESSLSLIQPSQNDKAILATASSPSSPSCPQLLQTSNLTERNLENQLRGIQQLENYLQTYKKQLLNYKTYVDNVYLIYNKEIAKLEQKCTNLEKQLAEEKKLNQSMKMKNQDLLLELDKTNEKMISSRASRRKERLSNNSNTEKQGRLSSNPKRNENTSTSTSRFRQNSSKISVYDIYNNSNFIVRSKSNPRLYPLPDNISENISHYYQQQSQFPSLPKQLDISTNNKYMHMYQHPIYHSHDPRQPHRYPNNTGGIYQQSSFTMKQYQQCIKQMQIIISKLAKNLQQERENRSKYMKEIERLKNIIIQSQQQIKAKNKNIYELEIKIIEKEKQIEKDKEISRERQRDKQVDGCYGDENQLYQSNYYSNTQQRYMGGAQMRISCKQKQNLTRSKQKYEQINRLLALSKQKQLEKYRNKNVEYNYTNRDNVNRIQQQYSQQNMEMRQNGGQPRYNVYNNRQVMSRRRNRNTCNPGYDNCNQNQSYNNEYYHSSNANMLKNPSAAYSSTSSNSNRINYNHVYNINKPRSSTKNKNEYQQESNIMIRSSRGNK